MSRSRKALWLLAIALMLVAADAPHSQQPGFHLEEATIDDLHRSIHSGQITCRGLIQLYIERAKAYNGVSNILVTADGRPIPPAPGVVRAGASLKFPTQTVAISSLLPNFDQYAGPPIEFGRMESTASDPTVQQQFGMTVGIPNAGQLNALGTINIRGERSVTCKGDRDRRLSEPLPPGSPTVCEEFRKQPDALERAAELDAQYGTNPDLAKMPMYCVAFTFKDSYDTKDMRSTGAGDANYDIDFPARDQTLVAQLRQKGAIIYAKTANTEYNGRPVPAIRGATGGERGANRPTKVFVSVQGYQRSTWSGNPSDVYDTTRAASLGSSSGSGVSVSANLTTCSICEETSMSCRGPSNHNSVALILPHKSLISYLGGSIGADIYLDRAGIMCRNVKDAAKVLDALKDPAEGYYDRRDIFTTVPRTSVLNRPYSDSVVLSGARGSLRGMRIGIVRESMVTFPGVMADEPISQAASKEIRAILGDYLGATLVESVDPLWPDDPSIEDMTPSYTEALAQLVPVFFPDILYRLRADGQPQFPEFVAKIKPTEFAPGKTFGTGTMKPIDYFVALAEGRVPIPQNLNIRAIEEVVESNAFTFHFNQYASRRAADWKDRGFTETLTDFAALNARSKFWGDDQRAAFKNWEEMDDMRNALGDRQGIDEHIMMRELLRRVEMKVILENHLDAVVRLHYSLPPGKIGLAPQPEPRDDIRGELRMGPFAGVTEVLIPAGYVQTVYDPVFVLSPDKKHYIPTNNNTPTTLPSPGLPFSLVFRAEPGKEDVIFKIASAYEAASKRRIPPPQFGPVPGEP
jgi:amidase